MNYVGVSCGCDVVNEVVCCVQMANFVKEEGVKTKQVAKLSAE